ncbi:MAG TPA: S8 family serine peptidase [Candidatus Xenobia bacterium]|nr:S8 family serine peptidase [Candidatus Xenobia bacterium]
MGESAVRRAYVCALLVFSATVLVPFVSAQVVGAGVYGALRESPRARVVVMLREPAIPYSTLSARMAAIGVAQSDVLSRVSPTEFTLTHRWKAISGFAGEVAPGGLEKLAAHPDVVRIDLDVGGAGNLAESVPLINAEAVHSMGFTGDGVVVAVLDSGYDTDHPDLSDDLLDQHCFCTLAGGGGCCPNGQTEQAGPGSAEDDSGHGTNVSGIITSKGTVSSVGVAPDAQVVAVKVLDSNNGFSSSSQVISGLDWVITNHPGVKAVNMSLGTFALFTGACDNATSFTLAFAQAINTLRANGALSFVSSGNNGSSTQMQAPACIANVVAVAAVWDANVGSQTQFSCTDMTTAADKITCFSNTSSALDLLAPGALITSTGIGGGTSTFRGTSQAAPHAAGAAALLWDARPELTPDQVEALFKVTGISVMDPDNGLSFPRIDVLAALNQSSNAPDINSGGVVNAASFSSAAVAPGSIVAVFGSNLATSAATASAVPLPTTLGGATMKFGSSQSVPKFFAAPLQANIQIPWELAGQANASLIDTVAGVPSAPEIVPLASFSPGLFALNQAGTGQGAILIANSATFAAPTGSIPGAQSRPAQRGVDFLEIYWTGGGAVTNQPSTGAAASADPLSATTTTPQVTIGGVPATVLFSGLAPGFVGLYVVTLQVPAGSPTGEAVPVVLTIGGISSNTVTIAVE